VDNLRLFWTRHGWSDANERVSAYEKEGNTNVGLADLGFQQAFNCGRFLNAYIKKHPSSNQTNPRMWSSPFLRTCQTRDIISHAAEGLFLPAEIRNEDALVEQNRGIASHYETIDDAIPDLGLLG